MPREPQHRDADLVVPGEYEVARVPKELGHDQQRAVGADGRRRHVGRGRGGIAVVPRVDDVTQPVGRVGVQSAQGRGHHAALLPLHEYPEALRQGVGGACAHDRLRIAQRNEDVVEEVVGAAGTGDDAAQRGDGRGRDGAGFPRRPDRDGRGAPPPPPRPRTTTSSSSCCRKPWGRTSPAP